MGAKSQRSNLDRSRVEAHGWIKVANLATSSAPGNVSLSQQSRSLLQGGHILYTPVTMDLCSLGRDHRTWMSGGLAVATQWIPSPKGED